MQYAAHNVQNMWPLEFQHNEININQISNIYDTLGVGLYSLVVTEFSIFT